MEAEEARKSSEGNALKSSAITDQVAENREIMLGFDTGMAACKSQITGRFKHVTGPFTRVNHFPHQSGYVNDVKMNSEQDDSLRNGKKSHKLGKRRVKDRSWRDAQN